MVVFWFFGVGAFVLVFLWWCSCGGVLVVVFLWWCFCGGVFVVVILWWCLRGGVFVVVFAWWCFCGGVCVVFFLWWCFCGGVLVVVFESSQHIVRVIRTKVQSIKVVTNHSIGTCSVDLYILYLFETSGTASCGTTGIYIYIYCRSAEALEDNVDAVNTLPGLGGEDQLYLSCQIRP